MIAVAPSRPSTAQSLDRVIAEIDGRGAAVTAVTLPAPGRRGTRPSLPAGLGPIVQWEDPVPDADGRVWSFAAAGDACLVEGVGDARIERVTEQARHLFASMASWTHPEAPYAPSVRLYGGVAFRPETARAASGPWARFQDASFTLPRWLLGTSGDRAFVRVCRRAGDALDLETLARILERPARSEGASDASTATSALDTTSFDAWSAMVQSALEHIRSGELEKVVPATICKVIAETALDPVAALERLTALYPECTRFAFQRGDAVFLGASPERLLVKRGRTVVSDALAGSTPRAASATEAEDAAACSALLASDKDRREHQTVVEAIAGVLRASGAELRIAAVPGVRTLRNVHHLWTPIHATLTTPTHVLDLVRSLHPTPAVCGTPRGAAIAWIDEHEPDTRGWYAGAVGWFDAEGDGAFSVAIRSGVLSGREAWLYAGAGIVEGSDPTLEYTETRAKRAPMLAALGLAR